MSIVVFLIWNFNIMKLLGTKVEPILTHHHFSAYSFLKAVIGNDFNAFLVGK